MGLKEMGKEMVKELNKLTKHELIRFCINEIGGRYCDGLGSLKFSVEQTLKHIKEEKKINLTKSALRLMRKCLKHRRSV